MIRRLQAWLSRYRGKGRLEDSDDSELKALSAPAVLYDKQALARARSQWQLGAWARLAALDLTAIQHHPDRSTLALYAAAGHLQEGSVAQARTLFQQALAWGCDRQLVTQVLLSGAHNSLGRAYAVAGARNDALSHLEESLTLIGDGVDVDLLKPVRVDQQLSRLGAWGESSVAAATLSKPAIAASSSLGVSRLPGQNREDSLKHKRLAIFVWYRSDKGGGLHENIRDTITYAQHAFREIVVVCPQSTFADQFRSAGASVVELDYENATGDSIEALVGSVDLVHVHPGKSRQLGILHAQRCHAPVVMTIHGKWMDGIEKYHPDLAHIIAVSLHIEEQIRSAIPNLRNKLTTVPNGVDTRRFERVDDVSANKQYVICCSRFDHDKPGLLLSLKALWAEQYSQGVCTPWLMVGEGPARADLEAAAEKLSESTAEVRFVGWRQKDDLRELHGRALVSISPGRSALEAMAMGVPTITCGAAGGLKVVNSFRDFKTAAYSNFGEFGSDYTADTTSVCVEFIRDIQENRLAYKRFVLDLSAKVHEDYDAKVLTERLLKIYKEVLF